MKLLTAKDPSGRWTIGTFGVMPPFTIPHPMGKYKSFQTSVWPSFGFSFCPVFASLSNEYIKKISLALTQIAIAFRSHFRFARIDDHRFLCLHRSIALSIGHVMHDAKQPNGVDESVATVGHAVLTRLVVKLAVGTDSVTIVVSAWGCKCKSLIKKMFLSILLFKLFHDPTHNGKLYNFK